MKICVSSTLSWLRLAGVCMRTDARCLPAVRLRDVLCTCSTFRTGTNTLFISPSLHPASCLALFSPTPPACLSPRQRHSPSPSQVRVAWWPQASPPTSSAGSRLSLLSGMQHVPPLHVYIPSAGPGLSWSVGRLWMSRGGRERGGWEVEACARGVRKRAEWWKGQ